MVAFAFLTPKFFKGGGNFQMVLFHSVNEKFSGAETQTPPTVINLNFLHSEVVGTLKYYSCTLAALCSHAFMLRGGGNHTYIQEESGLSDRWDSNS